VTPAVLQFYNAPCINYNTLPPLEEITGCSVAGLKKPELFSVAKELDLALPENPGKITGDKLKSDVSKAIEISTDPRFNQFHPATKGGAPSKTSADKDKQDVDAAAQKQDVAPSGCVSQSFLFSQSQTNLFLKCSWKVSDPAPHTVQGPQNVRPQSHRFRK
jgi:hypothetical protein